MTAPLPATGAEQAPADVPWSRLALAAYRALGHAISGDSVVVRSGVFSRRTAVLRRNAVIGWTFRQSILQRRLGLLSVEASTAAGDGAYGVPDADAREAIAFAHAAVPGLPAYQHRTLGSKQGGARC